MVVLLALHANVNALFAASTGDFVLTSGLQIVGPTDRIPIGISLREALQLLRTERLCFGRWLGLLGRPDCRLWCCMIRL